MTNRPHLFRFSRTLLMVACGLLLLCGVVVFRALAEYSALPERPDISNRSPLLAEQLGKTERSLFYPWSDRADRWFVLGELYHANRLLPEAEACYLRSLSLSDEKAGQVNYLLADLMKERGDLAAAKRYLAQASWLDADSMPALLDYAEVSAKSGDVAGALVLYQKVLEKDQDNAKALLELARVDFREGRPEAALQLLIRLVGREPNYVEGVSLLTQVLDTLGQGEKAAVIRSQMSRRKPVPRSNPWMDELLEHCYDTQRLSFLFEDYLKAGELERAFVYLDRMEVIEPDSSNPAMLRGYAYFQTKRYELAVPHYRRAIALGGDPASLYYYLVMCLFESGQLEAAEQAARSGLAVVPDTADLMVALGDVVLKRGRRGEGIEWLERALALAPAHVSANRTLAKLYWDAGKKASALDLLEMLRRLQPTDLSTRMTLGGYYLQQSDYAAAIAVGEEALLIDAGSTDARSLLSLAYLRSGNAVGRAGEFESALAYYGKAMAVDPGLEEAYLNTVKLLVHLKRYEEAESGIRSLMERKPEDPVLYVSLGDIQNASGDSLGARATWQSALSMGRASVDLESAIRERLAGK